MRVHNYHYNYNTHKHHHNNNNNKNNKNNSNKYYNTQSIRSSRRFNQTNSWRVIIFRTNAQLQLEGQ